MQSLLPPPSRQPLHDIAATRRIDADARARWPVNTLMPRAGASTARLARAVAPHARTAWVVAGPGNNGGDGIEAALRLHDAGLHVHVTLVRARQAVPPDAQAAMDRARDAGLPLHDADTMLPHLGEHDIAIDALLGIGAARAPEGDMAALIFQLNRVSCAVLAVDVPSGLNADTGQLLGDACTRASHTLTLLTAKPGLFTAQGRDHVGRVWLDDLGVDTTVEPPTAWLSGPPGTRQHRRHAHHKGSFGDVAVVGGATGMTGAAWLAARAAHAAGAGRVWVDMLDPSPAAIDPARPELMLRLGWSRGNAQELQRATVVCGCGGGETVRHALPQLLRFAPRLVLDADALNALATDTMLQALLRARAERGALTVVTPHPLEAARLLRTDAAKVQADRLGAAQQLAVNLNCVVVLKGSGSVIAAPSLVPAINPTGNASLATAGTGDVLAGWLGGRWSSSQPDASLQAVFDVAARAVWEHGHAADAGATWPLRAADLIERMHAASAGSGVAPRPAIRRSASTRRLA